VRSVPGAAPTRRAPAPPPPPRPFPQACNGSKYSDLVRCTSITNATECAEEPSCSPLPLGYDGSSNATTVCVSRWLLDMLVLPSDLNTTMQQVASFASEFYGECPGARVGVGRAAARLRRAGGPARGCSGRRQLRAARATAPGGIGRRWSPSAAVPSEVLPPGGRQQLAEQLADHLRRHLPPPPLQVIRDIGMACNFDSEQRCTATSACKWDPAATAGTGPLNSPCTLAEDQLQSVLLGSAAAGDFKRAMQSAVSECKLAATAEACLAGGALVSGAVADQAKDATFNTNANAAAAPRGLGGALLAAAAAVAAAALIL
jgi:hypothetical protein